MIKMLELLCKIPDIIGWIIVGVLCTLCAVMLFNLGKVLVQIWKDWHEEDEEEDCED